MSSFYCVLIHFISDICIYLLLYMCLPFMLLCIAYSWYIVYKIMFKKLKTADKDKFKSLTKFKSILNTLIIFNMILVRGYTKWNKWIKKTQLIIRHFYEVLVNIDNRENISLVHIKLSTYRCFKLRNIKKIKPLDFYL